MLLQKLVLKYYWPLLRFVNLEEIGGYYSRNGEDKLILSILLSHVLKNKNATFIEINKPEIFPYSLLTILLGIGSCRAILINSYKQIALSYAKEPIELPNLSKTYQLKNHDLLGCLNEYKDTSILYTYSSIEQLLSSLQNKKASYSLVVLSLDTESIRILDGLVKDSLIFSIMILNNNSGLFSIGNMKIREKLARNGFIFHTRLNGRDDFFVLSELINGFPSKLFGLINTTTLQRWVSSPPGSDYSKPR